MIQARLMVLFLLLSNRCFNRYLDETMTRKQTATFLLCPTGPGSGDPHMRHMESLRSKQPTLTASEQQR